MDFKKMSDQELMAWAATALEWGLQLAEFEGYSRQECAEEHAVLAELQRRSNLATEKQ